ncbi:2-methylcitrate dehydratase PrpD [Roseovarius tolerans]|uniref:2-methylcitrate dehydratase PrpD n=1 Tax=Roseovarius tolerans TaxID=74031 RepID=A0A1H8HIC0_9RHOB|nr:MmgE/PrpD family protein [Roseovarius tolerans]SEN55804.1 2-methylcitrate dehydratase PrpD [Roseovarius tolerans]
MSQTVCKAPPSCVTMDHGQILKGAIMFYAANPRQFDPIARFALDPDLTVPEEVLLQTATLLIDTLGVAAGAAALDVGRIAREFACDFHGAAREEHRATLLFDGRRCAMPGVAWALATQIDNLDAHDGLNATKGHIGCALVPALFAFAEARPSLTGRQALTALTMGYEVAARAAVALHATVSDYHTSGAWNALGVAALGAHLRGDTEEVLRHALGIAEYHGPRSQMMREIASPTMLHDGSGMGAFVGISSLLQAERGFTGAPAITVEGAEVAHVWADLGRDWTVMRNYIKPYPICRWAHGGLECLRVLAEEEGVTPDHIETLEVATFAQSAALFPGMPETTSEAQYSLGFALAAYLVHGRLGPAEITGDALRDPCVAAMHARITVREEPRHSARFPEGRWSDVTVRLKDGREVHSGDCNARGGPEAPMPEADIRAKLSVMAGGTLTEARIDALWSMRRRMLDQGTEFSQLASLVTPEPDAP